MDAGEDGRPIVVWVSGRRYAVEAVLETWRIDDEWWRRRPVSRVYYSLLLEEGQTATVFWDSLTGSWFKQRDIIVPAGQDSSSERF